MNQSQPSEKKRFWIVSGTGTGNTALTAFDAAVLNAGIGNFNLVKVSSIVPPGCVLEKESPEAFLNPGSIVHCAFAHGVAKRGDEPVSAAVGVALPERPDAIGVIMEIAVPSDEDEARKIVRGMCQESMEMRSLGVKEILLASAQARPPEDEDCFSVAVAAVLIQ
jgi:arginine decarboxylase